MASFNFMTSTSVRCTVTATEISTNASANTSVVRVTINYARTSGSYTTGNTGGTATITCDGQVAYGPNSIYMDSSNGYNVSFSHDFTITHNSNGGKTISFCYQYTGPTGTVTYIACSQQCSGSYNANLTLTTFNTSTAPTLSGWEYKGCTWNSVSQKINLTSWGNGGSTSARTLQLLVGDSSSTITSGAFGNWPRRMRDFGAVTTAEGAVTTSNTQQGSSAFNIRGCTAFRLATYATNGAKDARTYPGSVPVRYTPPSPLTTLSHSDTFQSTNIKVSITIVGGNSTNNNDVNVTTQYRRNVANAGWTDWANVGSAAKPWATQTASFEVGYGQSVVVQARQVYQGAASEVKALSWTASTGTQPTMGTVSVKSMTWNSATLALSGFSYGNPNGNANRYIEGGVGASTNTGNFWGAGHRRWANVKAVTSADITVNNSSAVADGFTLKGLTPFKYGACVSNTSLNNTSQWSNQVVILPPAPITASIAQKNNADDSISANVTITSSSTNNLAGNIWYRIDYKPQGGSALDNQGSHTVGSTITVPLNNLASNQKYNIDVYDFAHKLTNATSGTEWNNSEKKNFTYYSAPKKPTISIVEVGDSWFKVHYSINAGSGAKNLSLVAEVTGGGTTRKEYLAYTGTNTESEAYVVNLQGNTEYSVMLYLEQETTNQKSNSVNIKVTPRAGFSNLYGSVDGKAVKINKLYASVDNKAIALTKLYIGDENGKARLVYEE